jgi:2,4-dienoyl-CoA reductase-like NADH-dependent reductase (Old Yellow Enzyme family)
MEVAGMHLRNRLVMLPMVTNLSNADGTVSDSLVAHYGARAAREVGLVIVETTPVAPDARNCVNNLGAWDDDHIPGLARLAARIKAGGAAVAIQLMHAGAKTVAGLPAVSPSGLPLRASEPPRSLDEGELQAIVGQFAQAARRVKSAGFDAVEIHAAHMYLLSEFLSPFSNKRQDRYGGNSARRAQLVADVVCAVRRQVGPDFPVLLRLHGQERVQGGMTQNEILATARRLAEAGVDAFDVSALREGEQVEKNGFTYWATRPYLTKDNPPGAAVGHAAAIRQATGVPVIAVGKMGVPEVAERTLASGQADLVGVGRGFLCDPGLGPKLLAGRVEDIVRCDECFVCLDTVVARHRPIRCTLNRSLGRMPEVRAEAAG